MKQVIYYHSGKRLVFYGRDEAELTENLVDYLYNKGEKPDEDVIKKFVRNGIHGKPSRVTIKEDKKKRGKDITAKSAIKTSLAIVRSMTSPVDQALYDSRIAICKSCALFQSASDCFG